MPQYIKNSGFTKHWQSANVGSNIGLNSDGSGSADHFVRKLNFSPGGEFILVHGRNISSSAAATATSPKWTYLQLHQSQSGVKGGFELANKNAGSSEVFYAELGVDVESFSDASSTAKNYRERFFVNTEWISNREFIIMTRDGLETGSAYPLPGQTISAGGNGTGNPKVIVMTGSADGSSWTVHQEIGSTAAANNNFVSSAPTYLRGKAGLASNYKWESQPTSRLAIFSQNNVNQYSGSLEPSRNYVTILQRDMDSGGWSFHSNLAVGHASNLGTNGSSAAFAEIDIEHVSWIGSGDEQETHLLVQYGTGHHTQSSSPVSRARQEIFKYNGSSWERYTQGDGTTYLELSTNSSNRQAMFLNQAPQYNPFSKKLTYMYPWSDSFVWIMQFPSASGWIPDYLENGLDYTNYGQQLSEDAAQASRVGVNSVKWNFYSGGLSAVYAMNGAFSFPNVGLTGTMQLYYVESGSSDDYGWYGQRTGNRQGEQGLYFNNNDVQSGSQYGDTSKIYHHAYRENWDTDAGKGGAYGASGNRFVWEGSVSANRTPGGGRTQALIVAHMNAFPAADPDIEDSVTESITVSGGTVKAGGTEGTPDVTVTIPSNGLNGTTTLGADVSGDSNPNNNGLSQLAPGMRAASKLISLTPHGTQFKSAVTIQFDLTDTSAGTINIFKRNSSTGTWYGVPRNLWARSGNTITISTTSFSDYMATIGDSNMARTILNNAQLAKLTQQNKVAGSSLDITGSGPSRATILAGDHFLVQPSGAGVPMPVSASVMREFFSDVSVESTDVSQAHRVIFAEHTGSNPGLKVDASTFTFNPSTDTLTAPTVSSTNVDGILGANSAAAATVTSLSVSDGNITNVGDINADEVSVDDAAVGLNINFGGNTGLDKISLADGQADALSVTDGSDDFLVFDTSGEKITLGKKLEAGSVEIEGSAFDINGGAIDGAIIGANSAAAGTFTTITAGGNVILGDAATDTVTVNADLASDLIPSADNTHDLGDGSNRYAQAHVVEAHIDQLGQALNVNSQNITNVASVSGTLASFHALSASHARIDNLDVYNINSVTQTETTLEVVDKKILAGSGSASAAVDGGGLQIGSDSNGDDTVASVLYDHSNTALDFNIGGTTQVRLQDGVLRPETDNDIDLGASGAEFKDLYLDGTANIDSLVADTADINGGTADNVVIGGSTAAAASFTTISSSAGLQVSSDAKVTGELSASLFVGNGQGLTNVGAASSEVDDYDTNPRKFFVPFLSGAAAASALHFDPGLHYTAGTVHGAGAILAMSGGLTVGGGIIIPDGGNIGSVSDTNAIAISSGGAVTVSATADASSTSTGALVVGGGVGIGAKLFVGNDAQIAGATTITNSTESTSTGTGALIVYGGVGIGGDANFADDVFLKSDEAVLNFGQDSEVKLTHVHETGLLLNSTNQLQFGDAGTYIHQSADGVLDLVSDTEIEINATTVDINGNVEMDSGLTVAGASVTFSALADLTATGGTAAASGDKFIIQDADASGVAKEITMAHVGHFLANTGSSTGIQVDSDGRMSIKYVEQVFMHTYHSGTAATDGHETLASNITASLSEIPLDDSLQVFLNGMLQTRSGSAGAGIFDYEYVIDTTPRKVQLVAGVDEDDVVVLKYIKK